MLKIALYAVSVFIILLVTIIVVVATASPLIAIPREIGPTVSPVGTATLAPKETL